MVAWNSHIIIFGLREVSLMAISSVNKFFNGQFACTDPSEEVTLLIVSQQRVF